MNTRLFVCLVIIFIFGSFVSSCKNPWVKDKNGGGSGGGDTFNYSLGEENIGKTGPAGGIVYYYSAAGFAVEGYSGTSGSFGAYTAHYLEAAPANESTAKWGAIGGEIGDVTKFFFPSDAEASWIGNGRKDTQIIVNYLAVMPGETGRAAQLCADKILNGYTDWFLPSLGELHELYKIKGKAGVPQTGIPTDHSFWSSSQYSGSYVWHHGFGDGEQAYYGKNYDNCVRAIRAF